MRLITQCPACSTKFKVVQDQLRISDGWVRCGQCDEVFDAHQHLETGSAEVGGFDAALKQQIESTTPHLASEQATPVQVPDAPVPSGGGQEDVLAVVPGSIARSEQDARDSGVDPWAALLSRSPLSDSSHAANPSPLGDDFAYAGEPTLPPSAPTTPVGHFASSVLSDHAEGTVPSFMRLQSSPSRATRVGHFLLGITALFGAMALLLQIAVHERDQWAAYQPSIRPVLQMVCTWTGCEVKPLRSIDALAIDHSSFVKVRDGVFRLNVVLKNMSALAVATPALELALTNMQDQTMVRRVLGAADMPNQPIELAPHSELSISLVLGIQGGIQGAVQGEAVVQQVAGYRVLAFYP